MILVIKSNTFHSILCTKTNISVFIFLYFCCLCHFISVHAWLGFCNVNLSLAATLTVAGANGGPGLSAHFLVEEESSSGDASVITRPRRAAGEAAWESLNNRKTATYTCAQVVLPGQILFKSVCQKMSSALLKSKRVDFLHYPVKPKVSVMSLCNLNNRVLMCVFLLTDSVGPWLPWSQWSMCSVSCGGGQQSRSRLCSSPPCSGLSRQSKTCNTQVCLGEFPFPVEYLYLWHQTYFNCKIQG